MGGTCMRKSTSLLILITGLLSATMAGHAFAQAGTGPGSGVPGLGGSQPSGTGDAKRDPHSGTIIPNSGQSQSSTGIAEQPSGLGEKGSGQSQSTIERSGGKQSGMEESTAKSSAESGK